MKTVILPYTIGSEGANNLSQAMNVLKIRRENSRYKHRPDNAVINWGCPERPVHIPEDAVVINPFESVAIASNKISSFKAFNDNGINCPYSTTDKDEAYELVE
jgi:hypothetical protein